MKSQEKTIEGISGFDKSKLKPTEVSEKGVLPDDAGEWKTPFILTHKQTEKIHVESRKLHFLSVLLILCFIIYYI